MAWLWLYGAIFLEVGATIGLRLSEGMSDLRWFALAMLLYVLSFVAMAKTLAHLPIGVVYAIWSGVGTALIVTFGALYNKDPLTPLRLLLVFVIVGGTIGLNLTTTDRS